MDLKHATLDMDNFDGSALVSALVTREVRSITLTNGSRFGKIELPGDATMADAVRAIDGKMAGWGGCAFIEMFTAAHYHPVAKHLTVSVFIGS